MLDDQRPRRVVPRWRPSWVTATNAEARSTSPPGKQTEGSKSREDLEVSHKIQEFQVLRSVPVAAELMFLASATGNEVAARQAAKLILANQEQIGAKQLVKSAKQVLNADVPNRLESSSRDFVRHARTLLGIDIEILSCLSIQLGSLRQGGTKGQRFATFEQQ